MMLVVDNECFMHFFLVHNITLFTYKTIIVAHKNLSDMLRYSEVYTLGECERYFFNNFVLDVYGIDRIQIDAKLLNLKVNIIISDRYIFCVCIYIRKNKI